MLIPRAGSDYQIARVTLDAGQARDIMLMLLDVHAVLDHLHLDGTRPQATAPATAWLEESASPYTLPGLIDALDEIIGQLCRAHNEAFGAIPPTQARQHRDHPANGDF